MLTLFMQDIHHKSESLKWNRACSPSGTSGAVVATNSFAHARSWHATHRHSKHMRPILVANIQRVTIAKYYGHGIAAHFAHVVKFNCASDGSRLTYKDILMMLFAARHPLTRLVQAMWGPHQVAATLPLGFFQSL